MPRRTAPIRNRASPAQAGSNGDRNPISAAIDQGFETARLIVETADKTMAGAVERGVETAYMVIEEYLQRGREAAARQHAKRRTGRPDMNNDRPNDGWPGQFGPMAMVMTPWLQMMRMWSDSMSAFMPGASGMTADWMNAFMPGMRTPLSIRVASKNPVTVTVDLVPGAEYRKLRVQALKHAKLPDSRITAPSIQSSRGRLRVNLTVPDDQPAGRYRATIRDNAGARCGTLTVEIQTPKTADTNSAAT
jgi:hypothetical protein